MAEIGDKLLTLPILQLEMSSLHQKLRFEKPEWNIKLKKLNWCRIVQIQGKGREGFARDLGKKSAFQQIQVKFYQLFATVLR